MFTNITASLDQYSIINGSAYCFGIDSTAIGSINEVPYLYISNPLNNTTNVNLFLKRFACLSAAQNGLLKMYVNPIVSNAGVSQTAVNLKINSNSAPHTALLYRDPVGTSFGTFILALSATNFNITESFIYQVLTPGNSFLFTITLSLAGTGLSLKSAGGKEIKYMDYLMQFFEYKHLPESLQEISKPFGELAKQILETLPYNQERTTALRKLLESKDCAVRAQSLNERELNAGLV